VEPQPPAVGFSAIAGPNRIDWADDKSRASECLGISQLAEWRTVRRKLRLEKWTSKILPAFRRWVRVPARPNASRGAGKLVG
jgi:hypothetical protein